MPDKKGRGRPSKRPNNADLLANADKMSIKELAILYNAGESSIKRWLHDARGGKRPNKKQKRKATQSARTKENAAEMANISYLLAPQSNEMPAEFVKRTTGEIVIKNDRVRSGLNVNDLIRRRQAILDYITPNVRTLTGRDDLIKLDYVVHKKSAYSVIDASVFCRYKTDLPDDATKEMKEARNKYGDLYMSYYDEIREYSSDEYQIILDIMFKIKRR